MFEAVAGAFFLGTPFNGSPAAIIGARLAQLGQQVDMASQSKLLDLMKPGNEGLRELKMEFMRLTTLLSQKIELVCFFETQPTLLKTGFFSFNSVLPRDTTLVVDRDSATLDGVESVAVDSDHPGLSKFTGFKDRRYDQLIRPYLKKIIHGAALIVKNRFNSARGVDQLVLNNIIDKLDGARVNSSRRNLEKKYTPSPWISKEKEFADWLGKREISTRSESLKNDRVCVWIRGSEGRGKTNAMITALADIEKLRSQAQAQAQMPVLVAYYFCDVSTAYPPAEALLRSLVSQLIHQHEMLAPCGKCFIRNGSNGRESASSVSAPLTVENLWSTLLDMLADRSLTGRVFFVINNLHALPEGLESTKKLLHFLNAEFQSTANRCSEGQVETRWLLTSRESLHIKEILKPDWTCLIDLEDEEKYGTQIQSELRHHAEKKIDLLGNEKGYSKALTFFASSTLGKQAPNSQWIDIVVAQLQNLIPEGAPESKVRRTIGEYPRDSKQLLDKAWSQILDFDDDDKIKEMLRVLVLTYEDPTLEELEMLSDIQSEESHKNKVGELVEKCKPLLTTKGLPKGPKTVCFLNSAVKSHLTENESLLGLSVEELKMQHGLMSLRSFSHLTERLPFYGTSESYRNVQTTGPGFARTVRRTSLDTVGSDEDYDDDIDDAFSTAETLLHSSADGKRQQHTVLAYAVQYWLSHASLATLGIAENLSSEEDFWRTESNIRRRWLLEYTRLTNGFKGFQPESFTALHVASSIGFRGLAAALIKNGHQNEINVKDASWNTPLHLASHFAKDEVIDVLLEHGADINLGMDDGRPTPLHSATLQGNVQTIQQLLGHGARPNAISKDIGPVINAAVSSGNLGAVEILMKTEKDAPLDAQMNDFLSPLAAAALCSDLAVFDNLTQSYANGSRPEEFSKALLAAAAAGRSEVCKKLLVYQHSLEDLQEAMDSAARASRWAVVRIFLETCPGLNCQDVLLQTALCSGEETDTVEAVWRYTGGNLPPQIVDRALYEATDREKISTIQLLLRDFRASPNATGEEYGNALTASAYDGTLHILRELLDAGADIDSPHGWALQTASAHGHYQVVEELLKRGANVNAFTTNRYFKQGTSLQAACETGKDDIVAILLENGADPDLGAGPDSAPLIAAARRGEDQILRHLIMAKPRTNFLGGPDQSSPLIYAAGSASANSVRLLLKAGAEVNLPDKEGNTALIMASSRGDRNCVEELLKSGADVTLTNDIPPNINALSAAVQSGNLECLDLLVNKVSLILNQLKPTMDFAAMAKVELCTDAGIQCQLEPTWRGIPAEKLRPTADSKIQCEMKLLAEAGVQCDMLPPEAFFSPPFEQSSLDQSIQIDAEDIDLQNLSASLEEPDGKELSKQKKAWRKVPVSTFPFQFHMMSTVTWLGAAVRVSIIIWYNALLLH